MRNLLKTVVEDYGWIHTGLGLLGNVMFFVGSILFLITSLVMMGSNPESGPVPHLGATVGIALFVISVFVLILFVHHLGRSIVADEVIQHVGRNLEETIQSACTTLAAPIKAAEKAQTTLPDPQDITKDQGICISLPIVGQHKRFSDLLQCLLESHRGVPGQLSLIQHLGFQAAPIANVEVALHQRCAPKEHRRLLVHSF